MSRLAGRARDSVAQQRSLRAREDAAGTGRREAESAQVPDPVVPVLEGVCDEFDGLSSKHAPVVLLTDFGDSSVNYQVFVWTEDPWNIRTLKSKLNEAVWWGLKDAGIEIAFPQLDLHLNKSLEAKLP